MITNKKQIKRKSLLSFFFLGLVLFMFFIPRNVYAGEKEIEVPFPKEYQSVTFSISTTEAGNYKGIIKSPQGTTYDCVTLDEMNLSCTIKKVTKGTWTLTITDDAKSVMPTFSISVTADTSHSSDIVDESISVGKDINGLKIYLKDDSIVAEWTDDSCGNVNISVINLNTSETLANKTVKNKYFECGIPSGTKEVIINVVPSSSSNIAGATLSYTFEINNFPYATVNFPKNSYINQDTIPVEVVLNQPYCVMATNNGEEVFRSDVLEAGAHILDIPAEYEGLNDIKVFVIENNGNMRSSSASFTKDVIAPELSLAEEYDGIETYDAVHTITGKVANFDSFTINGTPVDVTTDGTFIFDCTLHVGLNSIVVTASDYAGNETSYGITINMLEKEEFSFSSTHAIIIVAVVLILCYVIIQKKKRNPVKSISASNSINHTDEAVISSENDSSEELKKDSSSDDLNQLNKDEDDLVSENANDKRSKKKLKKEAKSDLDEKKNFLASVFNEPIVKYSTVLCIIIFIVFTFLLQLSTVTSSSMEPTLEVGDVCIYNRLAYVVRSPQRGEVVNFQLNDDTVYGKRIIGVEGDLIEFADGYVYLNGERLDESAYLLPETETNCVSSFSIPDGCVFLMGDNRENSYDCRFWDTPYIPIENIQSKYWFTVPIIKSLK